MLIINMLLCLIYFTSYTQKTSKPDSKRQAPQVTSIQHAQQLVVLGTVQDAGSPQLGCYKDCCKHIQSSPPLDRKITSLGLINFERKTSYLFEATPDIKSQLHHLNQFSGFETFLPKGIFLTHAHIGHYTGLMQLGREAYNASNNTIYTMPRMKGFLSSNGPWSQLVTNDNIVIKQMENDSPVLLDDALTVIPFLVPHRDEFSETVGYKIIGPNKSVVFIPDIDKWDKWSESILDYIRSCDIAFLDATFYDAEEINHRDIREVPHPFVIESMELFQNLSPEDKSKVHFIHFNHTNPLLDTTSMAYKRVLAAGYKVARYGQVIDL